MDVGTQKYRNKEKELKITCIVISLELFNTASMNIVEAIYLDACQGRVQEFIEI